MQGRHAVDGLEAAARRHHVEAVSAVAGDVEVVFGVAVLHHHDEPRPAVGQVVAGHAFTALRKEKTNLRCSYCLRCLQAHVLLQVQSGNSAHGFNNLLQQ